MDMKHVIITCVAAVLLSATSAHAECAVEIKAKRNNPTEYRHDVIQVPDDKCGADVVERFVRKQLKDSGWTLLAIVKVGT